MSSMKNSTYRVSVPKSAASILRVRAARMRLSMSDYVLQEMLKDEYDRGVCFSDIRVGCVIWPVQKSEVRRLFDLGASNSNISDHLGVPLRPVQRITCLWDKARLGEMYLQAEMAQNNGDVERSVLLWNNLADNIH